MKNNKTKSAFYIDSVNLTAYSAGLLQGTAYSRLHTRLSRALVGFNLSIPEWKLLGQVFEKGEVKLSDLSTLLSYDPPMVTRLVKQLERKKHLQRYADKTDERAKVVVITKRGASIIKDAEPVIKKTMRVILKGISPDELLTYLKVLNTIVINTEL